MEWFDNSERYGVDAASYLARTRQRLLDKAKSSLFYAALELRCCVEARQSEYLEHLVAYRGKKLRPHRIGENRGKIAKISGGKLIAKMEFHFENGDGFVGYHTPVPASLVKYCERSIDELRHAQEGFRAGDDPWWEKTRDDLIDHYRVAWVACQGNLLVPPLWYGNGKAAHPLVIEGREADRAVLKLMSDSVGRHFSVNIDYLESAPENWVCDL